MVKVLGVSKKFFALPPEEKKKWHGEAALFHGYGNDAVFSGNQPLNWSDRLYLPADLGGLPENPPEFR